MPRPRHPDDTLPPAPRRAVVVAILALHAAAGWGLLQVQGVREGLTAAAPPMVVDLLAPPPPAPLAPPPPPQPAPRRPPPPVPRVTAEAPPQPAPAPFVAPPPEPAPAPAASPAPPAPSTAATPPPAAPAPPAPPRLVPSTAVQYLVRPDVVYPSASRRLGEQGTVLVSVLIDEQGLPRELRLLQSSGFERLDRAALAGVQAARFRPHTDNGRAVAVRAHIPLAFDLEN